MFGQIRWLGAGLVVCLASCSVDETTQVEDTGGTGGSSGIGGGTFGGTGGTGATGGSGGNLGGSAGATGGAAGQPSGGAAGAPAGGSAGVPSGGGTGGVVDPCAGKCTDQNATCSGSGSCDCNADYLNVDTDGDAQTADCKSAIITDVTAELAVTHESCGNLVIKLRGPDNTLITLMSRPGEAEAADDGSSGSGGDQSDMTASAPVTFDDAAGPSAETMGSGPPGEVVCQQSACDFHPDHGAATGPATLAAAFDGKNALGTWRMCVGDAVNNNVGTFQSWELRVTTSNHQFVKATGTNLNLTVPDDGYTGALDPAGAACVDITLP